MALITCNFYAASLGFCTNVQVLLPYGNHSDAVSLDWGTLYPKQPALKTLYLLHGMYEDETIWVRKSNIERYAAAKQVAVVFPSVQNSYYTNMRCGPDYFTYLTEELPAFVGSVFPLSQKREDTCIAGLSMGGYGACKAAFKRPDLYAAFASLSGALDIGGIADYIASGAEQRMFESVFGDPEAARGGPDDLTTIAGQAKQSAQKLPRAYFACGTLDRLCYPMNQRMLSCLNDLGIPYTYEEGPGMHNWEFWDTYIQRALDWMFPAER